MVTNQYFSAVTTLSLQFATDPIDGILGLAYPALSQLPGVNMSFLLQLPRLIAFLGTILCFGRHTERCRFE